MLFALDLALRQRRQRLHLVVRPASPIERMIGITGLDRAVATHPEREAAVEAASRREEARGDNAVAATVAPLDLDAPEEGA
jgi:hypothetical protein